MDACLELAREMKAAERQGSIVTLICDGGERYEETYYNPDWLAAQNLDIAPDLELHQRVE